jgi:hypothetical protein
LSQSEQPRLSFGAEVIATGKLASLSPWSVIRDAAFDIAAVHEITIPKSLRIGTSKNCATDGTSHSVHHPSKSITFWKKGA